MFSIWLIISFANAFLKLFQLILIYRRYYAFFSVIFFNSICSRINFFSWYILMMTIISFYFSIIFLWCWLLWIVFVSNLFRHWICANSNCLKKFFNLMLCIFINAFAKNLFFLNSRFLILNWSSSLSKINFTFSYRLKRRLVVNVTNFLSVAK
jgi:hypothetical protein